MKRSQRHQTKKRTWTIILIVLFIGLLAGSGYYYQAFVINKPHINETENDDTNKDEKNENNPEENEEPETEPEPETFTDIQIAVAGDVMFHKTQIDGAYDSKTKTYDFKPTFQHVKPYFTAADLAIVNYETTAAGPERAYSGYPSFNAPDETIDALKDAGIDVLTTANNHSLDTGIDGLKRTVEVMKEKGLASNGTYDKKPDSRVLFQDVKGIKVAILAYTESTNGLGDQYGDALHDMLNIMNKDTIIADIKEAKAGGADFIISAMHWGVEYAEEPNDKQKEFAELMASEGVDVILGSHPHVIQKSDLLEVNGNEAFVIYSMGNFVSNQRRETLGDGYENTENGVIVQIDVRQNDQTKETFIQNITYVPTWVHRYQDSDSAKQVYRILPVEEFVNSDKMPKDAKSRMQNAFEATTSIMKSFSKAVNE